MQIKMHGARRLHLKMQETARKTRDFTGLVEDGLKKERENPQRKGLGFFKPIRDQEMRGLEKKVPAPEFDLEDEDNSLLLQIQANISEGNEKWEVSTLRGSEIREGGPSNTI